MPTRTIDPSEVVGPVRTVDPNDIQGAADASMNAPPSAADQHPVLSGIRDRIRGVQDDFDANTATSPQEPLLETGLKRVVRFAGSPFVHPLDTLQGAANMIPSNPDQVTPTNQPEHPLIQRGQEAVSDYHQGGLPYAATKLGGDILGGYLGGKVLGAGVKAASTLPERLGNPAPNYVPHVEQSVRGMVKSLNLPTGNVEPLVKDLMGPNEDGSVAGIIRHYAAKAGKPMQGPLDAAKVAEKAGKDVMAHYESILKPIEGEQVKVGSVSPIGIGEGKYATLRAINDRITHINQALDAAQDAKAAGNPSPIANEVELASEGRNLNQMLYRTIAKKTGIPETEIGTLRQTYGKLLSASKTFTQAANAVKAASATPPKTITEGMSRAMDALHGGTEGVFNRRFRSTLPDVPVTEPALPQGQLPANHAVPPAPIPATPPPAKPSSVNPDMEEAVFMKTYRQLKALKAQEEVLKMHATEQAAQELAANRAQQAKLIREGIITRDQP